MNTGRPISIMFDHNARARLAQQRSERAEGVEVPLRWHQLLDWLSRTHTGRGVTETSMTHVLSGRARLLAWQPSYNALLAAMGLGGLIYLCWGFPYRVGWRDRRLELILRRAQHLLVNDDATKAEIAGRIGREAQIVPFFVDTQFFAFRPLHGRDDFLFCNGINDRDPDLLLSLARRGHRIVWLVNDDSLFQKYEGSHANLSLRRNVTYAELRFLYQTCRATIMPTIRDAHCAGQTTGMEAISCGAPLLMSPGRTAGILAPLPSVVVVADNSSDSWDAAVRAMSVNVGQDTWQTALLASRDLLVPLISTASVTAALTPIFHWQPVGIAPSECDMLK